MKTLLASALLVSLIVLGGVVYYCPRQSHATFVVSELDQEPTGLIADMGQSRHTVEYRIHNLGRQPLRFVGISGEA
jgi:hypothetical protein